MKQLLVDTILFSASPRMIAESERKNDGKVIVSGVLQRAEAKNQNGRVYPKKILMREVKKYAETNIKENRALGELDHPDSSVINRGNPGPWVGYDRTKDRDVVPYAEIIE